MQLLYSIDGEMLAVTIDSNVSEPEWLRGLPICISSIVTVSISPYIYVGSMGVACPLLIYTPLVLCSHDWNYKNYDSQK